SPPRRCSNVDFPAPLAPTIATASPGATLISTPSSMTSSLPSPPTKVLRRSWPARTGGGAVRQTVLIRSVGSDPVRTIPGTSLMSNRLDRLESRRLTRGVDRRRKGDKDTRHDDQDQVRDVEGEGERVHQVDIPRQRDQLE